MIRMTRKEYENFLRKSGKASTQYIEEKSKYHNKRIYVYEDGFVSQGKTTGHGNLLSRYDSTKEYYRWNELVLLAKCGLIKNLQRQVSLVIQDAFTDASGKRHRPITYRADAMYVQNGRTIVEDVKAFDKKRNKYLTTESFNIKWKLLQKRYPQYTFRIY